jgi:hypothetical protein
MCEYFFQAYLFVLYLTVAGMAEHSGLIIYSENEEDARASLAV